MIKIGARSGNNLLMTDKVLFLLTDSETMTMNKVTGFSFFTLPL